MTAVACLSALAACGASRMMSVTPQGHGDSAVGYGVVPFATPKEYVAQLLQGRGFWSYVPGNMNEMMVTYQDRFHYYPVQVRQYFDEKGASKKAEVFILPAAQPGVDESTCADYFQQLYAHLEDKYGTPDWAPRASGDKYLTTFTFRDTSDIVVQYTYDVNTQGPDCNVWLTYNPPWM